MLAPDEVDRATSYPDTARGERFALGRGILRLVLAEACGTHPRDLTFVVGEHGKPALAGAPAFQGVQFNLSHAKRGVVVAVAAGTRVGVDVAWTGGRAPIERVAERFFSPAERVALFEAPATERRERFHRTWTRKEALLKGVGNGITAAIHGTDFSGVAPGSTDETILCEQGGERWRVRDLRGLPDGYVGSVAIEARWV